MRDKRERERGQYISYNVRTSVGINSAWNKNELVGGWVEEGSTTARRGPTLISLDCMVASTQKMVSALTVSTGKPRGQHTRARKLHGRQPRRPP